MYFGGSSILSSWVDVHVESRLHVMAENTSHWTFLDCVVKLEGFTAKLDTVQFCEVDSFARVGELRFSLEVSPNDVSSTDDASVLILLNVKSPKDLLLRELGFCLIDNLADDDKSRSVSVNGSEYTEEWQHRGGDDYTLCFCLFVFNCLILIFKTITRRSPNSFPVNKEHIIQHESVSNTNTIRKACHKESRCMCCIRSC